MSIARDSTDVDKFLDTSPTDRIEEASAAVRRIVCEHCTDAASHLVSLPVAGQLHQPGHQNVISP